MSMRRRDYQKKSFKNPFFSRKTSDRRGRFKAVIFLVVIIAGLIFLSHRKFFAITDVSITGSQTVLAKEISPIINDQLVQKRFWFFGQDNILFFNSNELKQRLAQNYIFSDLKVKKQLFHKLNIEIKEDVAPFFWFSGGKKYYLNSAGLALKEVSDQDLSVQAREEGTAVIRFSPQETNYPVVFDQSNAEVKIGQPVIDSAKAEFITNLTSSVFNSADFEIAHYTVTDPVSFDLNLVTTEGWQAYFRTTEPLDQQFNKLLMLLQQRLGNRANLEYIDLRFAEKIFYK